MKKIYILIILFIICGKMYDINAHKKVRNEAIKEIENYKQLDLYYDEFSDKYIIKVNGNIYEKTDNDIIYINEYEDYNTYNEIISK